MISQFLKMVSRSPAMHAGIAAAFVCGLEVTEADARSFGADEFGTEHETVLKLITRRHSPGEMTLAQSADDCGCDDVHDFDDEYADEFEEDFDEDYSEEDGGSADNQGITAEQQRRLDAVVEQRFRIIEAQERWRGPWF